MTSHKLSEIEKTDTPHIQVLEPGITGECLDCKVFVFAHRDAGLGHGPVSHTHEQVGLVESVARLDVADDVKEMEF